MAVNQKATSIAEFERFIVLPENRNSHFELINGEIVEKVVTEEHGIIAVNISTPIKIYLREHKIGRIAVEARHQPPGDDQNSRLPDVSVTCDMDRPIVKSGAVLSMPDLAIEIKSPDDTYKEMREKARFYLANGSRLVWLVFPEKRIVEVYSQDVEQVLDIDETLTGGDVLPGFSLPVREIFEV